MSHSQNITEISNEGEAQISQSEERLSGAEPAQARKLKLKARATELDEKESASSNNKTRRENIAERKV